MFMKQNKFSSYIGVPCSMYTPPPTLWEEIKHPNTGETAKLPGAQGCFYCVTCRLEGTSVHAHVEAETDTGCLPLSLSISRQGLSLGLKGQFRLSGPGLQAQR